MSFVVGTTSSESKNYVEWEGHTEMPQLDFFFFLFLLIFAKVYNKVNSKQTVACTAKKLTGNLDNFAPSPAASIRIRTF